MSKNPKKPHYIRPNFEPEWEDEAVPETPIDSRLKEEEESRLFKYTIENAKIPVKDHEKEKRAQADQLAHNSKTRTAKKSSSGRVDIDLHGMTVREAQNHVLHTIQTLIDQSQGKILDIRIITGKGNNSAGGKPQLISSIHHVVEARFSERIISMEVSPHELKLGGSFVKGHFDLRIK
jgi:DNA-nicking Smr family endonuclease